MGQVRLIAFEGSDGTGKTTQARLLVGKLERMGVDVRALKFPNYESLSSGPVRMYLNGELGGSPADLDPYAASLLYSVDRFCSYKSDWEKDYRAGRLIVADRYVTSNMIFMAARLPKKERQGYIDWLSELEYGRMGLPAPDMVFYLDLPAKVSERLVRLRSGETGIGEDIHEKDRQYQQLVRQTGREVAKTLGWTVINCSRNGMLLPVEELSEVIMAKIPRASL